MDNLVWIVISFIPFLAAISVHECAHAYSALRMGDPTPQAQGRVTLNPFAHIDPFGTVLLPLMLAISGLPPFGYAKPVQINPYNFRDAGKGLMISTACGPLSNLAQGFVFGLCGRLLLLAFPRQLSGSVLETLLVLFCLIPFVLAVFNLIPLGPLDGHAILRYFLPYRQATAYHEFNVRYGTFVLFGLLLVGPLTHIPVLYYMLWPARFLASLVIGIRLY
jgi:Zn-dependent protease